MPLSTLLNPHPWLAILLTIQEYLFFFSEQLQGVIVWDRKKMKQADADKENIFQAKSPQLIKKTSEEKVLS